MLLLLQVTLLLPINFLLALIVSIGYASINFVEDEPSYVTFQFAFNWKNPSLGFYVSLDLMNLDNIITGLLVNFLTDFKASYENYL